MSTTDPSPLETPVINQQITKPIDNNTTLNPEQKDIDSTTDDQALIANAISGDKIKEMLSASGPSVKSVLLKADGTAEEIIYDSTPSTNHVAQILSAPPSIIGQYPDLNVIVVGPRYQESKQEFELNQHKLRYPFNNDTFYGDIFLYRFDEDCVVQDFTLKEYQTFAAKSDEDIGKVFKPIINDEPTVYDEEEQYEDDGQLQEDFMREIIVNKVKAEFPAKFGREPTEEELESYIAGIMSAAGGLFGIMEEEDVEDEEYDPEEDEDEDDDIANEEELEQDKKDIEHDANINRLPLKDVNEEDEHELVNSAAFEVELREAMSCVQNMGKIDREKILRMAKEEYKKDIGQEPTEEMMTEALSMFKMNCDAEENDVKEENEEDIDIAKEMDEALDVVRGLGKEHQKSLMNKICGTFSEINGAEPTEEQLADIFGRIKESLQDEAREEFIETNDVEDDVDDLDYKPDEGDIQQIEDDKKIEVLEELMGHKVDEEDKKVKILVTPVKKGKSGSRMGIYLDEQKDAKKTLEVAASKFEQINHRGLTDNDSERLEKFLETGMLFESSVNPDIKECDDEDYVPEQDSFDYEKDIEDAIAFAQKGDCAFESEEEDEEYCPEKDTFDYTKDIEDDNAMEEENELNENEDTSNIINID